MNINFIGTTYPFQLELVSRYINEHLADITCLEKEEAIYYMGAKIEKIDRYEILVVFLKD